MKKFFINSLILILLFLSLQITNDSAFAEQHDTCTPVCTGTGVGTAKPITCCPSKTYICPSKIICCEKGKPGCYENKKCNVGAGSCQ